MLWNNLGLCHIEVAELNPAAAAFRRSQRMFRRFGDSGLEMELLVWLEEASARDALVDRLNDAVYKAFSARRIQIPYDTHDVYIKGLPPGLSPGGDS